MSSFLSSIFGGKPAQSQPQSQPQSEPQSPSPSAPSSGPTTLLPPPEIRGRTASPTSTSAAITTATLTPRPDDNDTTTPAARSSIFPPRSMRQLGLFFGGWAFLALSVAASRRAVARHTASSQLRFYQPNHRATPSSSLPEAVEGLSAEAQTKAAAQTGRDPMVALEALNLATLNVVSFAIMMTGGAAFALDVSSVDDLRKLARRTLENGGKGGGLADEAAEREVAEWVASVLKIKEEKKKGDDKGVDGGRK